MSKTKCQCSLSNPRLHLIIPNRMRTGTQRTQKLVRRHLCDLVSVGCQSLLRTFIFRLLLNSVSLTVSGRRNLWLWVMPLCPTFLKLLLYGWFLYCCNFYIFLQGKAKKKKPCTRPIPFNLSQPKSSRVTTENEQLLTVSQSRTASRAVHPTKNICNDRLKTPNSNSKLTKHPATLDSNVDSTKGAGKSQGKTSQPPGQCVPSSKLKTSANSSHLPSSVSNNTLPQNNAASSAQACADNMNLLSLRSPTKTPNAPQNMQLTAKGKPSKSSNGKLILPAPCDCFWGRHICACKTWS